MFTRDFKLFLTKEKQIALFEISMISIGLGDRAQHLSPLAAESVS